MTSMKPFCLIRSLFVCDMKWADWEYIDENEDHFPGVHESFKLNGVDKFVGQKLTKWNDEQFMLFYSSTHFYPDVRIVWMSEGMRYQSTFEEWAKLINAQKSMRMNLKIQQKKRKRMKMLHQLQSLRSLWEMLSSQGLPHQSPKLLPKQQLKLRSPLSPREATKTLLQK